MPDIYDVYICGHVHVSDSTPSDDGLSPYKYFSYACSKEECSSGDQNRFLQNRYAAVDDGDRSVLNEITNTIAKMRYVDIPTVLSKFDNQPMLIEDVEEVAYDYVFKLLCAEDSERLNAIDSFFNFPILEHTLEEAAQCTHRNFFDFCAGQALDWYAEARDAYHILNETVDEMLHRELMSNYVVPVPTVRWPNVRYTYEPHFGTEELQILLSAGFQGLLASPITGRNLCHAAALVKLSKEPLAGLIVRLGPMSAVEREEVWRRWFKIHAACCRTWAALWGHPVSYFRV